MIISPIINDDVIIHSASFFVDEQIKEDRKAMRVKEKRKKNRPKAADIDLYMDEPIRQYQSFQELCG